MAIKEVFPYLRVHDGEGALDWYVKVFGGRVVNKLIDPSDGRLGHAEVVLEGGLEIMVSSEYPEAGIHGPRTVGGASMSVHLHVDDADALIATMAAHGAEVTRPATDHFYGERSGTVTDPYGHVWLIGHSIEEVSAEEMQQRWNAMMGG